MPEARGRGPYIDQGHNFSQYGPPGRQITFLFLFFYLFLLPETFVGFACHEFAVICWQDGKIPPAHETPRNQSDYRIFFILPARAPKKKKKKKILVD